MMAGPLQYSVENAAKVEKSLRERGTERQEINQGGEKKSGHAE